MTRSALALALALAACTPRTSIQLDYAEPGGKQVSASYSSDKDVAEPSFRLARDASGQVTGLELGAGSSLGSPVIEQNAAMWATLAPLIASTTAATIDALVRAGVIVAAPGTAPMMSNAERRIWDVQR